MCKGFIKVGAVVPKLKVGNTIFNTSEIINQIILNKNAQIITFPECSITGYTCQDAFLNSTLIKSVYQSIEKIKQCTRGINSAVIVGAPLLNGGRYYNCGIVFYNGEIMGVVPKSYLPNYNEFYEQRWFSSGLDAGQSEISINGKYYPFGVDLIFKINDEVKFAIEICEDLWAVTPPSSRLALAGANIIVNLSASNELIGKYEYRKKLVSMQSSKTLSAYIYASSGVNESTTDLLFSGHSLICENGIVLKENERFNFESNSILADIDYEFLNCERVTNKSFGICSENVNCREIPLDLKLNDYDIDRVYKKLPFVPSRENMKSRCEEIINIQSYALCKRMLSSGMNKLVIGVSGGLDSTLALLICMKAINILKLSSENVVAITMQGFGTTNRTKSNALKLMDLLKVSKREIPIVDSCNQHFKDISLNEVDSLAFENVQARERTQILFDIANMNNALVVGTGDLSELVLGWCTYNGDHMSSYGVNSSIPKTLVKYLVEYFANSCDNEDVKATLLDILDTPISPELQLNNSDKIVQATEDIVGSYEINDFFIYHFLRRKSSASKILYLAKKTFNLDESIIKERLSAFYKRFFINQFKRSCLPDGVKVGTVSVSPRGDLRLSSDTDFTIWLDEIKD